MSTAEEKFRDTVTATTLRGMMEGGYKTVYILDGIRYSVIYEAPINADIGDPSLRTILKYEDGAGGTSPLVIAQEEQVVAWPGYEIVSVGAGDDITLVP